MISRRISGESTSSSISFLKIGVELLGWRVRVWRMRILSGLGNSLYGAVRNCGFRGVNSLALKNSLFGWCMCFIVTTHTRDWSIGLFNSSIPYLIDQSHVLRLLLFNWLISMGFIIGFKGASSPLMACAPHAYALNFYYFTPFTSFLLHSSTIIVSINRNCLSDYF
jgi:hypothetical protein